MVKIVPIIVAQATHALVLARICVTTDNGHRVSSTAKVSFTKLLYDHTLKLNNPVVVHLAHTKIRAV